MDKEKIGLLCDKMESLCASLRAAVGGSSEEEDDDVEEEMDEGEAMAPAEDVSPKGGKVGAMLAMMRKGKK